MEDPGSVIGFENCTTDEKVDAAPGDRREGSPPVGLPPPRALRYMSWGRFSQTCKCARSC